MDLAEKFNTKTGIKKGDRAMKNASGFYNEKVIGKFTDALRKANEDVKSGTINKVTISDNNSKMGKVASVSLLPFLTCPSRCKGTCGGICYAAKIANMRPSVLTSYARNTAIAMHKPELFWAQVNAAMMAVRFFRFHVSGDILNAEYFGRLVSACKANRHCEVLVFTKRYEIVNAWISENGELPENLHLLFSGWENLKTINPHGLPETNVYGKGEEPDPEWKLCGGNCFECGCRGLGCWQAKKGDVVAFQKH